MGKRVTVAGARRKLEDAARSISSVRKAQIRRGKAIPFGPLTVPEPNRDPNRQPLPFTGGN